MQKYIHDSLVIFRRSMVLAVQNPIWVLISVMQPILYLTLFGPLLLTISKTPGFPPGDAWQVFVPGLLVQLGIFGALFVGFSIVAEWRSGVIDRMMVTPASRTALITGRVMRDMVMVVVQGSILLTVAYFFGLRAPWAGVIGGLIMLALLGAAFAYFSYAAGLWLKSEDALAPLINSFALPILLLSGILLPMSLAPQWLQILSDVNPIKHIVTGLRAVFRGEIWSGETGLGLVLAIAILLVAGYVGNLIFKAQTK